MGHQLKLNIYCFSIKSKTNRDSEYVKFGDFFRENYFVDDEESLVLEKDLLIKRFIGGFIDSFNKEFVLNKEETKGIATAYIKPYPSSNIIDGMINGGLTGIDQNIFKRNNSTKSQDKIEKDKIAALPYYFKLWVPFDGSIGIIMLQSYTDMGVNTLVMDQLKNYFKEKNYSFEKFKYMPEEYKTKFKAESKIYKVTFVKQKLSTESRAAFNPVFTAKENLKITVTMSGFEETPKRFMKLLRKGKIINADLTALEMVEDDDFETIVTYKDSLGHQSSAKISKDFDIYPTIFLDDSLKQNGTEYPDYNLIRKHTIEILETIQVEIGYKPEDVV